MKIKKLFTSVFTFLMICFLTTGLNIAMAKAAAINIKNIDISKYPQITVYFEVKGVNANSLSKSGFSIKDLDGNIINPSKFLASNQTGKRISSLMMDTSGSMYGYPLNKAKEISKNFVEKILKNSNNSLDLYEFNDFSSRRSTFNDSRAVMKSIINQFNAIGGTAMYDAIYDGINSISLQRGAKSIIVVTDGDDNCSQHDVDEVKALSVERRVPVYIVQIGNYNSGLEELAKHTGGRYYTDSIDNLSKRLVSVYGLGNNLASVTFTARNKRPNSNDYLTLSYAKGNLNFEDEVSYSSNIKDIPLQNRITNITSSGNRPSETSASSGNTYFYHPIYAFDDTASSAWVVNKPNSWIKASFNRNEEIKSIYIRSGYWYQENHQDRSDSYAILHNRLKENSRPQKIKVTASNGYSKVFTLKDYAKQDINSLVDITGKALKAGQQLNLGKGIRAKWIKIEILSSYKGSKWPKDICISDIILK